MPLLADKISQTLSLADGDRVWFDALAHSLHPGGYTSEVASVLAAQLRKFADEGRCELRGTDGIINQVGVGGKRAP